MTGIRAGADGACHPYGTVEIHHRTGHDAVERLYGGKPPIHALVVHRFVGVYAGECIPVRQSESVAFDELVNDVIVRVVGGGFSKG